MADVRADRHQSIQSHDRIWTYASGLAGTSSLLLFAPLFVFLNAPFIHMYQQTCVYPDHHLGAEESSSRWLAKLRLFGPLGKLGVRIKLPGLLSDQTGRPWGPSPQISWCCVLRVLECLGLLGGPLSPGEGRETILSRVSACRNCAKLMGSSTIDK